MITVRYIYRVKIRKCLLKQVREPIHVQKLYNPVDLEVKDFFYGQVRDMQSLVSWF